ncbi:hypothetical protein BC835DRAFT_1326273 [Cytidiella melzeri]|nr:hypothetical protein BC835DRAFT_1326273 [Cytidiella melzeri]
MRFCSSVRSFSLFTLVVLSSHSFMANAQSSSGSGSLTTSPGPPASTPSVPPTILPPTFQSSSPLSSSLPSSSRPAPSTSPSPPAESTKTSTSDLPPPTSSSTDQSSSSFQSSSSTASSSVSSSSISASSSSSVPRSSSSATAVVVVTPAASAYSKYSYTGHLTTETSSSGAPSETAVSAAAGSSFSKNKGAIAAVATIASLMGVAIVGYVVFKLVRRQSRLRDEEEDVYFEKYQEQDPPFQSGGANESSYNIASATQPASTAAYPDRSMHYGAPPPTQQAYADPQQYGMQYPPGTAYAAAAYGTPYLYHGDGGGYGAASAPGNHPFAHPENSGRPLAAPRVSPPPRHTASDSHDTAYAT